MSKFSTRTTQFSYFDKQLGHPIWAEKNILDFGGNVGGFLESANAGINHDLYWCVDLSRAAIEVGKRRFPGAHFVFYDRYSCEYNPTGIRGLELPDLGRAFDFVLAFSVFTHTAKAEMLELVDQLKTKLNGNGVLAFTFTDPHYDPNRGSNLKHRLELWKQRYPAIDVNALLDKASGARWCTLINDLLYVEPDDMSAQIEQSGASYLTFFTWEYMKTIFPNAEILPPVSPEWQHCCIIRKGAADE